MRPQAFILLVMLFISSEGVFSNEWMRWEGELNNQLVIGSIDALDDFNVIMDEGEWGATPFCFPWKAESGLLHPGVGWKRGDYLLELRALGRPTHGGHQVLPTISSLFCRFSEPIGKVEAIQVVDLLGTGRPQVHLVRRGERERLEYIMLVQKRDERGWTLQVHRKKYLGAGLGQMRGFWATSEGGELFLHVWGSQKNLVFGLREGWQKEVSKEVETTGIPLVDVPMEVSLAPIPKSASLQRRGWLGGFRDEVKPSNLVIQWVKIDPKGDVEISVNRKAHEGQLFLYLKFEDELKGESVSRKVNLNRRRGEKDLVHIAGDHLKGWQKGKLEISVKNSEGHLLDRRSCGIYDRPFTSIQAQFYFQASEIERIWRRKARGYGSEVGVRYEGPASQLRKGVPALNLSSLSSWSEIVRNFQAAESSDPWLWSWFSPLSISFTSQEASLIRREKSLLKKNDEIQLKNMNQNFEIKVLDHDGKSLEHHPVELGVVGSKFRWKGISGNGGIIDFPKNQLSIWSEAASRSPLYLKSYLKGRHFQAGVNIMERGFSDIAFSPSSQKTLWGKGVAQLGSSLYEENIGKGLGKLICTAQAQNPLGWYESEWGASLVSASKRDSWGLHMCKSRGAPLLMAAKLEEGSFLEVVKSGPGLMLRMTQWIEGEDGFWKETSLGSRALDHLPRSILLLSTNEGLRPIVSDRLGVTLFDLELKPLQSWKRSGMVQLDLASRDGGRFWVLDRRSNRQSWLYGMKITDNRIEQEGVVNEPISVGAETSSGRMVWDHSSQSFWILDFLEKKLRLYELDGWGVIEKKEVPISEKVRETYRMDHKSTLHLIGNQPWLWTSKGLFQLKNGP